MARPPCEEMFELILLSQANKNKVTTNKAKKFIKSEEIFYQ